MNCRNCGAPIEPGARFCRKCGTDVPQTPVVAPRTSVFQKAVAAVKKLFDRPFFHNKKLLLTIGGGTALAVLILILILSIVSCSGKKLRTPEDVADAVLSALETGDGAALAKMAALSEPVCGAHPEIFGEGDTPHKVMTGYYKTLAETHCEAWKEAYGKRFDLTAQLETDTYTGMDLFEINRALDIDAQQYKVLTGPLLIDGKTVGSISMTVVEWDGEWQLLVLYVD